MLDQIPSISTTNSILSHALFEDVHNHYHPMLWIFLIIDRSKVLVSFFCIFYYYCRRTFTVQLNWIIPYVFVTILLLFINPLFIASKHGMRCIFWCICVEPGGKGGFCTSRISWNFLVLLGFWGWVCEIPLTRDPISWQKPIETVCW